METTYRIAEVARRSGFTTSTLRYYEQIGLLQPVARTGAGYRVYDDDALDRLAFIARAKQVGCSLDEIVDLTRAWDGGRCAPVQAKLQELVDDKIADAQTRIGALTRLTAELQQTRATLGAHTPDGPCDDRCGCTSTTVACTLAPTEMDARLADWRAVLSPASRRVPIDDGVRIELESTASIMELARLTAAEQECCRFFRFDITVDDRGIGLEVRAPEAAHDLVLATFGEDATDALGE